MTQMGFFFDQTRCTGCYTCAVACKDWNDIDAGPANWMRIIEVEEGSYPNLFLAYLAQPCCHCENPPCASACPVSAIHKREEDGVVLVDSETCAGREECRSACLKACPWDVPQFGPEADAKMQKCTFCLDRLEKGQQTICIEACPLLALDAGPVHVLEEKYGNTTEAVGFRYFKRFQPSIRFKPREIPEED
jgi:anaerobic dimethyl sulfoxide reductase subunit B (iron-sulfur subunit)